MGAVVLIFIRLALWLVFLTTVCVRIMLWYQLVEEVERDLPLKERFTASVLGLSTLNTWRIWKRHRQLYPLSKLRRKLAFCEAAVPLSLIAFFASLGGSAGALK